MFVRGLMRFQFAEFDKATFKCCLNTEAAFADVYHSFVWIF